LNLVLRDKGSTQASQGIQFGPEFKLQDLGIIPINYRTYIEGT